VEEHPAIEVQRWAVGADRTVMGKKEPQAFTGDEGQRVPLVVQENLVAEQPEPQPGAGNGRETQQGQEQEVLPRRAPDLTF